MTARILIVGDFSGRASRGEHEPETLASRPRLHVDRDEVVARMAQLGVEVAISAGDRLTLTDIDDFEPDHLLAHLGVFDELRSIRARLQDPATFAAAAQEIGGVGDAPPDGIAMPDDLLAAAIANTEPTGRAPDGDSGAAMVDALARDLIAPFVIPRADPRLPELLEAVDSALGEHLRHVLRDPGFCAVEDAWTIVDQLTRRLETGPDLELRILDVTPAELAAAGETPGPTVLGGAASNAPAPDLVLVLQRFAATTAGATTLGAIVERIVQDGGVLVTDVDARLAGCTSDRLDADTDTWTGTLEPGAREAWGALRDRFGSAIAVFANRVPLRAPYGPRGASVDGISFDELADGGRSVRRLGSGAWTAALLFGRMALEGGGVPQQLGATCEVDRLPLALVEEHGETVQLPVAEVVLAERALGRLMELGIASVRSTRGSDAALVGPVRSLNGEPLANAR